MWTTVLLVVHLMIAAALVGVVLLQRSEGGALGIGGGGGGFMTGRGTANLLTRLTAGLAAAFFVTSIALTLIANKGASGPGGSVFDRVNVPAPSAPGTPAKDGAAAPAAAPAATIPAAPAPATAAPETRGGVLDALEQGKGGDRLPKK
jgi:preprotein translocase subunit SecG